MNLPDLIGASIGFLLTLAVFSYLIGDNPLFRLAIYIFIGVSTGYVFSVTLYNVLIPQLLLPMTLGNPAQISLALLPLLLGGLLITKISPRLAWLGNFPAAYLVGVGAAAAVGGALLGTLFPQTGAAINSLDASRNTLLDGIILLVGTLATLLYFSFSARPQSAGAAEQPVWLSSIGSLGQAFIGITFGVLFAGVYSAALVALIERLDSMWAFVQSLLANL